MTASHQNGPVINPYKKLNNLVLPNLEFSKRQANNDEIIGPANAQRAKRKIIAIGSNCLVLSCILFPFPILKWYFLVFRVTKIPQMSILLVNFFISSSC
jgi:hypothetical protein